MNLSVLGWYIKFPIISSWINLQELDTPRTPRTPQTPRVNRMDSIKEIIGDEEILDAVTTRSRGELKLRPVSIMLLLIKKLSSLFLGLYLEGLFVASGS